MGYGLSESLYNLKIFKKYYYSEKRELRKDEKCGLQTPRQLENMKPEVFEYLGSLKIWNAGCMQTPVQILETGMSAHLGTSKHENTYILGIFLRSSLVEGARHKNTSNMDAFSRLWVPGIKLAIVDLDTKTHPNWAWCCNERIGEQIPPLYDTTLRSVMSAQKILEGSTTFFDSFNFIIIVDIIYMMDYMLYVYNCAKNRVYIY